MIAYVLILFAALMRFVPFLPFAHGTFVFNFAPVGAALLFFGSRQPRGRMWIPLTIFLLTDLALNRFFYHLPVNISVFGSLLYYAIAMLLGGVLREKITVIRVAGISLTGSLTFFFISNFMVWMEGILYPRTWQGLTTCFIAAVPFFSGTLIGDSVYCLLFFGVPALAAAFNERTSAIGSGNGPTAA